MKIVSTAVKDGEFGYLFDNDPEGIFVPVKQGVVEEPTEGLGKFRNVSKSWEFRLLNIDEPMNIGTGGRIIANACRIGNLIQYNLVVTFGADPSIPKPEYDNDRFCFRPLDPYLAPPQVCFDYNILGHHNMVMDTKCGGWFEGGFGGFAKWTMSSKFGPVLVFGTCETSADKSGRLAYISWTYPAPKANIWCEGTRIMVSGAYEATPLPKIEPVAVPV